MLLRHQRCKRSRRRKVLTSIDLFSLWKLSSISGTMIWLYFLLVITDVKQYNAPGNTEKKTISWQTWTKTTEVSKYCKSFSFAHLNIILNNIWCQDTGHFVTSLFQWNSFKKLLRVDALSPSSFQQVFFVESVCDDPEVIAANILVWSHATSQTVTSLAWVKLVIY